VQNPKNHSEGLHDETRADICILGGLLFMWGVVPSFPFAVLVAASQKNPFWLSENGRRTFGWKKQIPASVAFLATLRATRISDMASF
jgi:hypothetical protein